MAFRRDVISSVPRGSLQKEGALVGAGTGVCVRTGMAVNVGDAIKAGEGVAGGRAVGGGGASTGMEQLARVKITRAGIYILGFILRPFNKKTGGRIRSIDCTPKHSNLQPFFIIRIMTSVRLPIGVMST